MTTIAHLIDTLSQGRPADDARGPVPRSPIALIVAPPATARRTAAALVRGWADAHPDGVGLEAPPAALWPFHHQLAVLPEDERPLIVWAPDLAAAFPDAQGPGARLVTTQPAYLLEVWREALGRRPGSLMLATAGPSFDARVPEAATARGVWRHVARVRHDDGDGATDDTADTAPAPPPHGGAAPTPIEQLAAAFAQPDPEARLAACVAALDAGRSPAALLAMGSTCMEVNDLAAARRVLDELLAAAPDWAAAYFESGKCWLRAEDMEAAARDFRAAAERLPGFAPAWANLGGTLGELDRPDEALHAFERAIAAEPTSHQALNNIGVVNRELGRLPESEAAFRQVIAQAPDLAMGHYNLGHTLFLQGRYQAALTSYLEGQRRDPGKNPVQASRLALARLASGDAEGALRDLRQCTSGLPREYRRQLLADTHAVAWALLTHRPDLPGWKTVADWIGGELAKA